MNIFALSSLISCIICIFLASFVYSQDKKNPLNRIFMVLCIVLAYTGFYEFMMRQAESFNTAYLWIKIGSFWTFSFALLLHFALIFTRRQKLLKNRLSYILIYGPALIFSLIELTTDLMSSHPVKKFWGYTYGGPENYWILLIGAIWAVVIGFLAVFLVIQYFLSTTDKKIKKQAKCMFMGLLIPMSTFLITDISFPLLKIQIPELGSISLAVMAIFIGYGMWKYELFVFNPATAAENIISTIADSIILNSPDGKILAANQYTYNLLGYKKEELVTQPFEVVLTEENLLFKGKGFEELVKKGSIWNLETSYMTKTGETVPVSITCSIMKDKERNIIGVVIIAKDITERRKIRKKLEESEKRYRVVTETVLVGIGIVDPDENIIFVNPAFAGMLGYTQDELMEMNLSQLTDQEEFVKYQEQTQLRKKGISSCYESRLQCKDGTIRNVLVSASLLIGANGTFKGTVGAITDITERKRMEEELKERMAELEKFTDIAVGRELKMAQMEKEIKSLRKELEKG